MAQQADKEVIMANRVARYAKCPFYRKHEGGKIKCEGLSDNSTIHLVFETPKERAIFMREHCNSITDCHACLIHKILYEKWGMGDE